jgi:EAL domain-containing protein (putative c-di-GMP-specific phosphodiesterase class I)
MRVWEFEDPKAIASDLVLEQDFIMRVRRLNRLGTRWLVINLVLNAIDNLARNRTALEAAQQRLQEFSKITNGLYAEMSNGDVFLSWEESRDTHALPSHLLTALASEDGIDSSKFLLVYHLPDGYTPVRSRINHYVEIARTAATIGKGEPERLLRTEAAEGPLTAWSVDQLQKLITDIDLRRYVRTQSIYEYQADGCWQALCEEYYVSFEDLKREYFPKIELVSPGHLFIELCQALDRRLLGELTLHYDSIAGRRIHFNISVGSIMGTVFAQFCRAIPKDARNLICFELHRGDLLNDFSLTLNTMMVLHREGFKVAIDSVTPDMANYVNLAAFEADYIKVNVSGERAELLKNAAIRDGLAKIPKEKLIFFRCDNDHGLKVGLEMGVGKFQGWLIDDAVQQGKGAA